MIAPAYNITQDEVDLIITRVVGVVQQVLGSGIEYPAMKV